MPHPVAPKKRGYGPPPASVPPRQSWPSHSSALLRSFGRADKKRRRRILERTIASLERQQQQQQKGRKKSKGGATGPDLGEAIEFYRYVLRRVGTPKGYKGGMKSAGMQQPKAAAAGGGGGIGKRKAFGGGKPPKRARADASSGDSSSLDDSSSSGESSSSSSSSSDSLSSDDESSVTSDSFLAQHNDLCEVCTTGGELLCCATCNLVFHMGCARPVLKVLPPDDWSCAFCINTGVTGHKSGSRERRRAGRAVAEMGRMQAEHREKREQAAAAAAQAKARLRQRTEKRGRSKVDVAPGAGDNESKMEIDDRQAAEEDGDRSSSDGVGLPRKELHQLLDTLTPEVNLEQPRGRRQRKAPTLFDPQICADSEWRSDGISEWRFLQAKAESERLARERAEMDGEAKDAPTPEAKAEIKSEAKAAGKTVGGPEAGKDVKKRREEEKVAYEDKQMGGCKKKIIQEEKPVGGGKKKMANVQCTFCNDDESVKVCCFCACRVCFNKHAKGHTLLCDGCDAEYHTFCLKPPLKEIPKDEDWFCPVCRGEVAQEGEMDQEEKCSSSRDATVESKSTKRMAATSTPLPTTTAMVAKSAKKESAPPTTPSTKMAVAPTAAKLSTQKPLNRKVDGKAATPFSQKKTEVKETPPFTQKKAESKIVANPSNKKVEVKAIAQPPQKMPESRLTTFSSEKNTEGKATGPPASKKIGVKSQTTPSHKRTEGKCATSFTQINTVEKVSIPPILKTAESKDLSPFTQKKGEGNVATLSTHKKMSAPLSAKKKAEGKAPTPSTDIKAETKVTTATQTKIEGKSVMPSKQTTATPPIHKKVEGKAPTMLAPEKSGGKAESTSTENAHGKAVCEGVTLSKTASITPSEMLASVKPPVLLSAPKQAAPGQKTPTRAPSKFMVRSSKPASPFAKPPLPPVAILASPAEVAKTTTRPGRSTAVSSTELAKIMMRQRTAAKSPAEVAKTITRSARFAAKSKVSTRAPLNPVAAENDTPSAKKRKTTGAAVSFVTKGTPSSPMARHIKTSAKQSVAQAGKQSGFLSGAAEQAAKVTKDKADKVAVTSAYQHKSPLATKEEEEDLPVPGAISADGMFYCTHEDETLSQVANKVGCEWRDLSSLGENTEWYGKLTFNTKFKKDTLLRIPEKAVPKGLSNTAAPEKQQPSKPPAAVSTTRQVDPRPKVTPLVPAAPPKLSTESVSSPEAKLQSQIPPAIPKPEQTQLPLPQPSQHHPVPQISHVLPGTPTTKSGRTVKRSSFFDEIEQSEQHLRSDLRSLVKTEKISTPNAQEMQKVGNTAGRSVPTENMPLSGVSEPVDAKVKPKSELSIGATEAKVQIKVPTSMISPAPTPSQPFPITTPAPKPSPSSSVPPSAPALTAVPIPAVALVPNPVSKPLAALTPASSESGHPIAACTSIAAATPTVPTAPSTIASSTTAAVAMAGGAATPASPPVKVPRRKPGARECMQISRRFGANVIPQKYMDILLDYCTRGKVEHLIRMRERLDDHSRFLELQLAGLESLVKQKGELTITVPRAEPEPDRVDEARPGGASGGAN